MPVSVRINAQGLRDLKGRFEQATPAKNGKFRKAVREIGREVSAKARDLAPKRTGRLASRINYRTDFEEPTRIRLQVYVGVPYGIYVVKGTRPHVIKPRKAKRLKFVVGGRTVFARHVNHPGTRPNDFLDRAVEMTDARAKAARIAAQVAVDITR